MLRAPRTAVTCALIALPLAPAAARAERLPLKTYGTAEGLPSSLVLRVMADSRGFLWIATRDGLSRFDGQRFVSYGVEHGLGVPTVNDILESRRGGYWVATNGAGVCWLDPEAPLLPSGAASVCRARPVGGDARSNRVNVVREDRGGRLWAGTDAGLFVLEADGGPSFRPVELPLLRREPEELAVAWLVEGSEGSLWIGMRVGDARVLRRWPDGRIVSYELPGTAKGPIRVMHGEEDGRIWVGNGDRLLLLRAAEKVSVEAVHEIVGATDVLRSADGRSWVATARGLVELDGRTAIRYTTSHGLSDNRLRTLAEDRDGNLWIGTHAVGLMKLVRHGLRSWGPEDGLASDEIHSLLEDTSGRLHVVSGAWTMSRFDGGRFTSVVPGPPGILREYGSQGGFLDHTGAWWLMSREGLGRYPSVARLEALAGRPPAVIYDEKNGLPVRHVYRAFEDSRGDLWLGARAPPALVRWERATGRFVRYAEASGVPAGASPYSFGEDGKGGLWIGFYDGGLVRRQGDRFQAIPNAPAGMITALHRDDAGRLWVASNQEGVVGLDDPASASPRWSARYTTAQGLASNNVRCLVSDRSGRLYLGTPRGVDRVDPSTGRVRHYTTSEGLASAFVTAAFRDREGALWFGTARGLSRLVPEREEVPAPPPVWIASVRAGGLPRPLSHLGQSEVSGLELGSDANQLQIDFFGLGFRAGESLRYVYRLEDVDHDWSGPTEERTVHYSRLSPGRYRFVVMAVSSDGVASTAPASVSFAVLPALWQRRPFQALLALGLALAVYAAHRYRVSHLLALERMRTRIAADLHDEIGSSLSRVAVLSEVVRRQIPALAEEPGRRLGEIADTARGLIDALSDIVWSINPQRDDLGSLVRRLREFAGDVLEEEGVRFELQAPPDLAGVRLPPEQRRHIFLVLKEALHNVARHAAARAASLRLELRDHELRAEVEDDGRGFSPETEGTDGHGLESMKSRAARLGATIEVHSAPGQGTRVRLAVPFRPGSTSMLLWWRGR